MLNLLSSTPGPASVRIWRTLLVFLLVMVSYLALTPKPLEGYESGLDKVGHFMAFTALAFSGYLAFPSSRGTRTALLFGPLAYGGLIEVLQLLCRVARRSGATCLPMGSVSRSVLAWHPSGSMSVPQRSLDDLPRVGAWRGLMPCNPGPLLGPMEHAVEHGSQNDQVDDRHQPESNRAKHLHGQPPTSNDRDVVARSVLRRKTGCKPRIYGVKAHAEARR